MKSKLFLLLLTLSACAQAYCQASATVSITGRATIIEPIGIEKNLDLDFGNIIATYNPGAVVLSPDGTRTATGVQLPNGLPGTVNPAEAVISHHELSYSLSLPESFTLYNQENPEKILVINNFIIAPEPLPVDQGRDLLKIGATLNLQADQDAGFYTNPTGFNVTVSYN